MLLVLRREVLVRSRLEMSLVTDGLRSGGIGGGRWTRDGASTYLFGAKLRWCRSSAYYNPVLVRSLGDESIKDEKFGAKVLRFIGG